MKNFKYPLSIKGSKQEFDELVPELTRLGYEFHLDAVQYESHDYLLTDFYRFQMGYNQDESMYNTTVVSASNPDLVLALAAMVDDDIYYEGEYIRHTDYNKLEETRGLIGSKVSNNRFYRKATKEEIINHFTNMAVPNNTMEQFPNNQRILGYKLKDNCKQYEGAAVRILQGNSNTLFGRMDHPVDIRMLKEAGVLDLWFEPVYKEEEEIKFKAGDWVYYKGVSGDGYGYNMCNQIIQLLEKDKGQYGNIISGLLRGQEDFVTRRKNETDKYYRISLKGIERHATKEEIGEAQIKIITLTCEGGTFEIEVSKKGIYYRPEDKFLHRNSIDGCINTNTKHWTIGGYEFIPLITHIDAGCKKKTKIEDWKKVIEEYDKIMKS